MHRTTTQHSKSSLKQRSAMNNVTYDASKYAAQTSNSYEQKPYAFMLDANVQDNYSAYRLNANMGLQPSPHKSMKIRQGFYGEMYTPDNHQGAISTNYTLANPNQSIEYSQGTHLRGGSLSRMDSWADPYQPRQEYQLYQSQSQHQQQPPQSQYIPQDPYGRGRQNANHALIQKNYLAGPSNAMVTSFPSLHENHLLMPTFQAYPQHIAIPVLQANPKRRYRRQDSAEESLLRVEQLMKHNNSHLERLMKDIEDNQTQTERHNRDSSLLGSPLRIGGRDHGLFSRESSLQNLDHYGQGEEKSTKHRDLSAKLPEIGKKDSPVRSPLGKIHADTDEDDNSPSNFRSMNFDRKKKNNNDLDLLNKIFKPMDTNPRSSGYLPDLKSPDALQKMNSSPGPRPGGFGELVEEEELSRSISLKDPAKKKKKKKKQAGIEPDTNTSIEIVDRTKENKRTLKLMLWAMVYPALLSRIVDKKISTNKEKYEHNSMKLLQDQRTCLLEFLNKHCITPLKSLYKEGKTLTLVNENLEAGTQIPEKDLKKRFALILARLTPIIESLNAAITETNLPKSLIEFFADITNNHSVVPPKFLTEFEITCLDVSYYGTLKNMTPIRVKMVIAMFVLVKGLIYVFIAQPWTFLLKMKESTSLAKKLKSCSSVLYHIVMDIFRENIQANRNNQAFITPEKRIKPLKNPLAVFTEADDFKKPNHETLVTEVIVGLYNKHELKTCFDSDKAGVEKLKTLVSDCLEKLFVIVEKAHEEKRKTKE